MLSIVARRYLRIGVMSLGVLLGIALVAGTFIKDVDAQVVRPPDAACRGCHDDSTHSLTLPSGEELSLRVDLPTLVASPHNRTAATPVTCTNCHVGQERYRYPHEPNPAQTQSDFRAEIAQTCAGCHYPHLPFHNEAGVDGDGEFVDALAEEGQADDEEMQGPLPTCVDCHGSHDVARVEEMGDAMPDHCLACHTDQDEAWAANFVTPRPGLGTGAEGYAGSTRCNGCHDGLYFTWHETLHANIVQDPSAFPDAILADFDADDTDLTFTRDEVAYVIGSRRRQVFLTKATAALTDTGALTSTNGLTDTIGVSETVATTETVEMAATADITETAAMTDTVTGTAEDIAADDDVAAHDMADGATSAEMNTTASDAGSLVLLPAQWTVTESTWDPLFGDGAAGDNWLASCAGCHVTGLDIERGGFTEFGVGCESCHGPAEAHASDPENVKPYVNKVDDQVCGACHSRGESPEGHPYPTTYRPGDTLATHFTLTESEDAVWADGSAKLNHQQYMDWNLGSTMVLDPDTSCTTCHQVHARGEAVAQLRQTTNELCLSCHNEQNAIVSHTPFHEQALTKREFLCTDCHMPKLASGAQPFDLHNHSLLQPDPQASVDHDGLAAMPNACNTCHKHESETPEWAAQTISYVATQATPSASSFFGPGPTPTSPPPPTPVSSVGEKGHVDLTPPLWWLRWLAFGVVGLIVVAGIVFVGNMVLQRRTRHV